MSRKYNPNEPSEFDTIINDASATHGYNGSALRKQLWLESGFKADAQSPTGPRGIAQFTKATAAAYGLSDEDRLNPQKAIDAAARHMADLTRKFNGDELKAALAYNVGEGPTGAPQLQAYDRGDFSAIGSEGLNYMRTMQDVTQSPQREAFNSFSLSAQEAFKGIGKKPTVGDELPQAQGISINGKAQEAANQPFGKDYYEAHGETLSDAEPDSYLGKFAKAFKGTGDAVNANIHNSVLGTAYNDLSGENPFETLQAHFTPTKWNSHQWSDDELQRIRSEVKSPAYINTVLGGDSETLDTLIQRANENYEYDAKASTAGGGAQIIGGITGAAFDPVTYIPGLGQASKVASLSAKFAQIGKVGLEAGALNVASEALRTTISGGDANYTEAFTGGLVLGGGLSALRTRIARDGAPSTAEAPTVPANGADPYASTTIRMETRLKAQNDALKNGTPDAEISDLSSAPMRDGEELKASSIGVPYVEGPHHADTGAVRLPSGQILSGGNVLNPHTVEQLATVEKANRGVSLGRGLSEVSMVIMRSDNEAIRSVGADLVRPTTGMAGGNTGKYGATAADISERLRYNDHAFYNAITDLQKAALRDPKYAVKGSGMSASEHSQALSRSIAEAVEDTSGAKMANLTATERQLAETVRDYHQFKAEGLKRPSMFGNKVDDSKGLMTASHFEGGYYPVRYDAAARSAALARVGGDVQELKDAVKASMLGSYNANASIKARVDAYLKASGESVEDYAERKAFGIANANGDAQAAYRRSTVFDEGELAVTDLSQNDYLKERHLFGNDHAVTLPDGSEFSINDLRHFDMDTVLPSYHRRINGDISIMGGTGKTTAELAKEIDAIKAGHQPTDAGYHDADALAEVVKILTGRARRTPDGAIGTLARSAADLAYTAKNAYMGVQNYTEIASMVTRGSMDALARSIPAIGKYMRKDRKLNAKEASEVHSVLFGKELDDSITPSRADVVERLRMNGSGNRVANTVGSIKWATGRMAQVWPMSRVMVATTNHIVRAARIETLGKLADFAHMGGDIGFHKGLIKSASISDEQLAGIVDVMKQHTYRDPRSGEYRFNDVEAMRLDPRTMDLWRLADHVASETVLRPDKVSMQSAKTYGGVVGMGLQFKNFVMRSVNGRAVRRFYEAKQNGRALDQSMTIAVELMLAGGFYALRSQVAALGMQDADAKRYLSTAMDPGVLGIGAITRSSTLGAPLGMYGFVAGPLGLPGGDLLKSYRTTMNPKPTVDKPWRPVKGSYAGDDYLSKVIDGAIEQVPGVQFGKDAAATFGNSLGWALTGNEGWRGQEAADATYRSLSRIVPNDPVTQWLLLQHFEHNVGIKQDSQRGKR